MNEETNYEALYNQILQELSNVQHVNRLLSLKLAELQEEINNAGPSVPKSGKSAPVGPSFKPKPQTS